MKGADFLVAAIRYGILSDCNDSGKDAENFALLRYRTDALRPFSLSRHDQTKRPPIGGLLFGSGDPIRTDDRSGMKGKIANAEKRGKYAKKRLNIWVFGVFHLV